MLEVLSLFCHEHCIISIYYLFNLSLFFSLIPFIPFRITFSFIYLTTLSKKTSKSLRDTRHPCLNPLLTSKYSPSPHPTLHMFCIIHIDSSRSQPNILQLHTLIIPSIVPLYILYHMSFPTP